MADETNQDSSSLLFTQLVMSFQAAAWQQMGKIANPITGKTERNLEMAKNSIDILGMLEEKTKGNLNEHELKFLQQMLTQLRMNYVEEMKKPEAEKMQKPEDSGKDEDHTEEKSDNDKKG